MNELPLVSIGAINYNNEKFVIETLDSIKAQSYPNIELIIVDDCSTDNSLALIKRWLESYPNKYRLIVHQSNKGVCAACNSALINATGKYFSYLGTDDILMPGKTANQVELLENSGPGAAVVYSDAYLINEDSSSRYGWFIQGCRSFAKVPSGNIYDELLLGNYIPGMATMIKKDCLADVGLYDEGLSYEDYDLWLRLAKKYDFIFSDYVSAKYRIRNTSLSFTLTSWNSSLLKIYLKHIAHPNAVRRINEIAVYAYRNRDRKALHELNKVPVKTNVLKKIILFSRYKIPVFMGNRILNKYLQVQ